MGGLVDRYVEETRIASPTLKYAVASARAIAASDRAPLLCRAVHEGVRSEHRIEAWAIAIANGPSFGSGMRIAPMAAIDDGRLEVVALTARSRLGLATLGPAIYAGEHVGRAGVVHFACEAIEIALAPDVPDRPVLLDVDGEPVGSLPLRVTVEKRRLRMRA
jgi:diacylglycerol kinase family enzyme